MITSQIDTAPKRVIVAHDGTIYTYELVGEPAPGHTLIKDKFQAAFESRLDDEAKAYEALEQLFGVRIVHRAPSGRGV